MIPLIKRSCHRLGHGNLLRPILEFGHVARQKTTFFKIIPDFLFDHSQGMLSGQGPVVKKFLLQILSGHPRVDLTLKITYPIEG